MKTEVLEFKVLEYDRIEANILRPEYMDHFSPYQQFNIQILGDRTTSLIAINEVADFLDFKSDVHFEWNFTVSDRVESNVLLAVIHAI